ncbi:hypothetical protein NDU88_001840 [Pleurodeles waltl]|uniref:Gypsy retrotransposon integrase-like protein 1 n=1 Tax=Pleurodeles waltl TaxID=8319 RepID=A0AAV7UX40_PLEWA|nr:hypothetical protein NDU88_001840 [Pleurodeles waltl]
MGRGKPRSEVGGRRRRRKQLLWRTKEHFFFLNGEECKHRLGAERQKVKKDYGAATNSSTRMPGGHLTERDDKSEPVDELVIVYAVNAIGEVSKGELTEQEWMSPCLDDEVLQEAKSYICGGWPNVKNLQEDLVPYKKVEEELCIVGNIVRRGNLLIVPVSLQMRVLELAHKGHLGIRAMKCRVRENFWWPGVDRAIERYVRECCMCVLSDKSQVTYPSPADPI